MAISAKQKNKKNTPNILMEMVLFFLTKKNLMLKKRVIRIGSINNMIFMLNFYFIKIGIFLSNIFIGIICFFVLISTINT
jgi:hypothetical protein